MYLMFPSVYVLPTNTPLYSCCVEIVQILLFDITGNTTSTQESETPPDTAPQSQTASEYRVDKDSSDSIIPSFQHTPNVNSSTPETAADDGSLSDSRKDAINSKTLDLECDDSSRDCETDVEAPTWALNPGEVEDEEKMGVPAVTQSMTVMEFSTKVVSLDGSGAAAEQGSQEDAEVRVMKRKRWCCKIWGMNLQFGWTIYFAAGFPCGIGRETNFC